uniref:PFK domain-containing protein n=1 Tax=Meloidogyne hapla TaxID=6305 RepID=A0A1I8BCG1_MELHA
MGRLTIIAPSMHVLHGLLNRAMRILWDNSGEDCVNMSYGIIGCKTDPHTQQFCGNSVKKIIVKRHDLALLIADIPKRRKWEELKFSISMFKNFII